MKRHVFATALFSCAVVFVCSCSSVEDQTDDSYAALGRRSEKVEFGEERLTGVSGTDREDEDLSEQEEESSFSEPEDDDLIVASSAVTISFDTGELLFSHNGEEVVENSPFPYLQALGTWQFHPEEKEDVTVTAEMLTGLPEFAAYLGITAGDTISMEHLLAGMLDGDFADTSKAFLVTNGLTLSEENFSAKEEAENFRSALANDLFLQVTGEMSVPIRFVKADGTVNSYVLPSKDTSFREKLEESTGTAIISTLMEESDEAGTSYLTFYENPDGELRIAALIGLPDDSEDVLLSQMEILMRY